MRMDYNSIEKWELANEEVRKNLPPGVKLFRTLRGHTGRICDIAWSPDGKFLASASEDRTVCLWNMDLGKPVHIFSGHEDRVYTVAWSHDGRKIASGSADYTIRIWNKDNMDLLRTLNAHGNSVFAVSWYPDGQLIASGSRNGTVLIWDNNGKIIEGLDYKYWVNNLAFSPDGHYLASVTGEGILYIWDVRNKGPSRTLMGHTSYAVGVAWSPDGKTIASSSFDHTIRIWNAETGKEIASLEGHTGPVGCISYSSDGKLLASKSNDGTIRIWRSDTWETITIIQDSSASSQKIQNNEYPNGDDFSLSAPYGLAFHPRLPFLATFGSDPDGLKDEDERVIHIYELELGILLGQTTLPAITYTSAKILLVGDSGVGKTGLGWRLAHGEFKEQSSTHGQQFWLLNQLCRQRSDCLQCEAVLWDLAGQEDYRLIHALFLDDADLALMLFDPARNDDLLSGIEFWLKQLKVDARPPSGTLTILIAARSDRGSPRLTQEELDAFCKQRGIKAYLPTSAKTGDGVEELIQLMQNLIPWDNKPTTITTETFKRIKDFLLNLKGDSRRMEVILKPEELRQRLERTDPEWKFSDAEMLTAVGHLANHGYVTQLKTSQGEQRILLAPELLNNLASSFVLEARRNQKGLGSLEEQRLLSRGYKFYELENLNDAEKDILLDSAVVLFLEHNVCFRETDPLNNRAYLVFPELINLKKPLIVNDTSTEDGVAYTVSGAVENVYASLVVLMGYTQTFTRTNQWRDHARYDVGSGHACSFRLEAERAGELDFVLNFDTNTPAPVRTLFQSLFENFLARRHLTVRRFEPVICSNGHPLNRAVVREHMSSGAEFAFCSRCGDKIVLPKADKPIQLTDRQSKEVEVNSRAADQRSRFEQALFRLKNYVNEQNIVVPECFISYAWGIPEHERWVELRLATDLQKAGVTVVLDRWENARIGASVVRFVQRVAETNRVIVVGTSLYRKKYDNKDIMQGFVVAAEGDLIGKRMIGDENEKESVLPVLLEGTEESAFPPLLQGRVYADFRNIEAYSYTMIELLLSLFQIPPNHPVAKELHESLVGQRER
jgi:small GTP-binding protein